MKLMIATTVFALTTATAFAQEADVNIPDLTKPEIALLDAAAIADKSAQGDLVSMELEYIAESDPVYLAELQSDTGLARLMIDGGTGDVLVSEVIDAQTEAAMDAYMENFSTQAEIAEMAAFQDMIADQLDDLSDEELAALLAEDEDPLHHDVADEDEVQRNAQ